MLIRAALLKNSLTNHKNIKIMEQKGNSKKGFASMDRQKQREIASKGGRASALGDTSRRGFASMDKAKQREISSQGGRSQGANRNKKNETAQTEGAGNEPGR
jgi:general stress protein YciG